MALRFRARPGRLLALALATVAFLGVIGSSAAYAAEDPAALGLTESAIMDLFQQLQAAPVVNANCNPCHGNIAKTENYASEIIFSHGQHIRMDCASCHSRFPHQQAGTEKPTMKGCYNCHGVRHGPMGIVASDVCNDCHVTQQMDLRPTWHTWDWAAKPHVAPAEKGFNTQCAMCHEPASCTECHDAEGINWAPASWDYDSGDGCLACHESQTLLKAAAGGTQSFKVFGLDDSAHQSLSCQKCHVDYRYDDKPSATPLWSVNAGLACMDCHEKADTGDAEKDKALSEPVPKYKESVHWAGIEEENYDSATCSSCHGGHFIYRLDTEYNRSRLHESSYRVCARCHNDPKSDSGARYDSYNDYYHGKAYKKGAPDAPACWDCHGAHMVLPSSDPSSTVSDENMGDTCGQEGCHKGSDQEFGQAAGQLIHGESKARLDNPLMQLIDNVFGGGE